MSRSGPVGRWSTLLRKIVVSPRSKAAGRSCMIMVPTIESLEKALPEEVARKQIHSSERVGQTRCPNNQALGSCPPPRSWKPHTVLWTPPQLGLQVMVLSLNLPSPDLVTLSHLPSASGGISSLPPSSPRWSTNPDATTILLKRTKKILCWSLLPVSTLIGLVLSAPRPGHHFNPSRLLDLSVAFLYQALRQAGTRLPN